MASPWTAEDETQFQLLSKKRDDHFSERRRLQRQIQNEEKCRLFLANLEDVSILKFPSNCVHVIPGGNRIDNNRGRFIAFVCGFQIVIVDRFTKSPYYFNFCDVAYEWGCVCSCSRFYPLVDGHTLSVREPCWDITGKIFMAVLYVSEHAECVVRWSRQSRQFEKHYRWHECFKIQRFYYITRPQQWATQISKQLEGKRCKCECKKWSCVECYCMWIISRNGEYEIRPNISDYDD